MKLIRLTFLCLIVLALAMPQVGSAQGGETLYLPSISAPADVLLSDTSPAVQAAAKKPLPPHSNAFGKSLTEWLTLYWTWNLGGDQEQQVGNVLFMPLPEGDEVTPIPVGDGVTKLVGETHVTIKSGTAFVLPIFSLIGETYTTDAPDDVPIPSEVFPDLASGIVTVDGHTLIDSTAGDFAKYYFGPEYFADTVFYAEPMERGDVDGDEDIDFAAGAIFAQGIGFIHPPLSVGQHTMKLYVDLSLFGIIFDNTWHITVATGK